MFVLTSPDKQGNRKIVNLAMFEGVMIEHTLDKYLVYPQFLIALILYIFL